MIRLQPATIDRFIDKDVSTLTVTVPFGSSSRLQDTLIDAAQAAGKRTRTEFDWDAGVEVGRAISVDDPTRDILEKLRGKRAPRGGHFDVWLKD